MMPDIKNILLGRSSGFSNLLIQYAVAVLVMVGVTLAFIPEVLQNKEIYKGDKLQSIAMKGDVKAFHDKTGELLHWTDRSYCGMPADLIYPVYPSNLASHVISNLGNWLHPQFVQLLLPMLCMFIGLVVMGYPVWLAVLGSLAFGFSTVNIGNMHAGHSSKVKALATAMPVIIGVYLVFRKDLLKGFALMALFGALHIATNHFQISYYALLVSGMVACFGLVSLVKTKQYSFIAKSISVLFVAALLAILPNVSMIWSNYDYMQHSVRGKKIVNLNQSDLGTHGLTRDYAGVFSHDMLELGSLFIPRMVGGSNNEQIGSKTESYKFIKRTGLQGTRINGETVTVPLFWGDKPLNQAPTYAGAVLILLALLGLVFTSKRKRWLFVFLLLATLVISMGNHLDIINKVMFDYLPYFNRFRAPSMILGITVGLAAWIAVDGLDKVTNSPDLLTSKRKGILSVAGVLAGVCLMIALAGPSLFNFSWDYGAETLGQGLDDNFRQNLIDKGNNPDQVDGLIQAFTLDRAALMSADAWRTLILIIITLGCFYCLYRKWLGAKLAIGVIGVIMLADLFWINKRYMSSDDFVKSPKFSKQYKFDDADKSIEQLSAPFDRMIDLKGAAWQNALPGYYHLNLGGNHAVKLRRYQDLIEFRLNDELNAVRSGTRTASVPAMNMLNLRFVKTGKGPKNYLENVTSLGYAWFVDSVAWAETAKAELTMLNSLQRTKHAVVHTEFEPYLDGFSADSSSFSKIELTYKRPGKIVYTTSTDVDRLMVMSEIWYKGNEHWTSTINGEKAEHIRANYLLRAIKVPAGVNEIVFEYRSIPFDKGEPISAAGSIILVLGLFGIFLHNLIKKEEPVKELM